MIRTRQVPKIELKLQPEHDGVKKLPAKVNHAINEYEQSNDKVASS